MNNPRIFLRRDGYPNCWSKEHSSFHQWFETENAALGTNLSRQSPRTNGRASFSTSQTLFYFHEAAARGRSSRRQERSVRTIQLRTKFLLSLLAISAGLTTATLLIVRYNMRAQVRDSIREDLRNAVNTYQIFEKQRQSTSTQSVRLIATLPYLRALMTTRDA